MNSIKILGTGHYTPEYIVRNEDFAEFLDTSDEWISTRTGMKERHLAIDEPTWLLGAKAAREALEASESKPCDIDLIIATTVTSDYYTPALACIIQRELGIDNAYAFDVNAACTGLAFAIDLARMYLCGGDYKRVLIVSSETTSQFIDYTDRSMCVLFGDGAGACVVEKSEGIYGNYQRNDISGTGIVYGQRKRRPTPFDNMTENEIPTPFPVDSTGYFTMNGRDLYRLVTSSMSSAIQNACSKAGITVSELTFIIPHQANIRIIETIAKNLAVPMDKMASNIEKYGNTSSASIPICLDEYIRDGRIKRGDKICLLGFGAGVNYAATVFEY